MHVLILSLLLSSLYALLALGFTLIFGVARVLNLAHGTFIMVSAYAALRISSALGLSIYLSAVGAVAFSTVFAVVLYKGLIRHIQARRMLTLIVTLAVAMLFEELVKHLFKGWYQLQPFVPGFIELLGVRVISDTALGFIVSWAAIGLFWGLVLKTALGKAILATAMERRGAQLVGIDIERVYTLAWGLSGALAGLAGLFLAAWFPIGPTMWRDPLVISFAIVVLGGIGSLKGSLLAAYLIGFIETLTMYTPGLGASWVGIPSLVILVLMLTLRPQGLFGREVL